MAAAVKKTSKAKKTPVKAQKPKKTSTYNGKITRVIAGVGIALVVLMLTVACFSYIFTGVDDQNVQQGELYGNVLGAVGYAISHVVMNRMGLSTFFIMAIGFAIAGIIILDKPFSRIALFISKMLLCALWVGVVVAYFSDIYSGKWGYNLHEMLYDKLGWGLALILLLFPLAWVIAHFSITPEKINQWREQRAEAKQLKADAQMEEEARREAENLALEKMAEAQDAAQSEPLVGGEVVEQEDHDVVEVPDYSSEDEKEKEPQVSPQEAFDIVDHGEKENYHNVADDISDEEEYTEQTIDGDFHASEPESSTQNDTLPAEGEVIHENDGGVDCTMTISPTEGEISEDLARQIVEKNGEYDPKLELSQFRFPTISMLRKFDNEGINVDKEEVVENRRRIVDTLKNYGIEISHIHSTIGPTVTLYEIIPAPGVKISKIKSLEDDIALSLSALGIRIIAPIPGKGTIGIEVPNKEPSVVSMNSVIASKKFQTAQMELPVAIGKNISNETVVFDLAKMPHLLMAGATGQGKSVGLNAVLASLLYKKHPSQVKFVLVDPKKVELTLYNKIERHYLAKLPDSTDAIITDTSKVIDTLNSLCAEMDKRYDLLKDAYVRNIKEYNSKFIARRLNPEKGHHFLPYIVLVVDEFADLIMTAGKEVETPIARLAQLARAVGIHLIIATQRPS
ncbi:MAG: DNA translocase FtsK, partial [Flavobacteriales bacterium]|nr:DNA translocase FtsK [Flavobacteriales bacterium]